MQDSIGESISQGLHNFQAAIIQSGDTFENFIREHYIRKWLGESLFHALAIRTTFVNALNNFLANAGLFNIEKVMLSPVTDPLAHDVEHTPSVRYKGHTYTTTHSMIYSKMLACFNPKIKGIYIDSPNIRLEIESPSGIQRNKYLIDFSQMDIELRRNRGLTFEEYLGNTEKVKKILAEDLEKALEFFEHMIVAVVTAVIEKNDEDLAALGVTLEVPERPFPRFRRDEAIKRLGTRAIEQPLGRTTRQQFFWITGILRENYDLIYPYLKADGTKVPLEELSSEMIYNYDLCAQSILRGTNQRGPAYEVLSGGIREWLYEPIIERLIDNKILKVRPEMKGGNIENIEELGGYGPFLMAAGQKDNDGRPLFPETFGGGLGIERTLFALTAGDKIRAVDEVTLFGKNPDTYPLYLF
jgi:aspartyl/asparaginyl-tRNA synthetase